jgi:hypothetical protein
MIGVGKVGKKMMRGNDWRGQSGKENVEGNDWRGQSRKESTRKCSGMQLSRLPSLV